MIRKQPESDLDRREREAQAALIVAEKAMKAADAALVDTKRDHASAMYAVLAIRYERQGHIRAAEDKQRQAERANRVAAKRAEALREFDKSLRAVNDERARHDEAGNLAGVAALDEHIQQLQKRRRELVNA